MKAVHLVGLSLGAVVALEFALSHRDRVRMLTLSAGFASLPVAMREQQHVMAQTLRAMGDDVAVAEPHQDAARQDLACLSPAQIADIIEEVSNFDRSREVEMLSLPALVAGSMTCLIFP